jgi:transcriptional regulator with XRE-family HTH domain
MLHIFNIDLMKLQELGYEIRKARLARDLTQAQLAEAARLSRTTLNQLENGLFPDLGVKKVQAILDRLGLDLTVEPAQKARRPDFIQMACTTASVSFKESLAPDELVRVLLSGKVPRDRRPHLRTLLEEAPRPLLEGLVQQVGKWSKPGKLAANVERIAAELGVSKRTRDWFKAA